MSDGKPMHALLIAEKPDLMRKIEEVYKNHIPEIPYRITFASQRGHLVTLKQPDELDEEMKEWSWETLPFHPEEHGGWQYKVIKEKKTGSYMTAQERYDHIKDELASKRYNFVINAGDPDQEGELLIRIVLSYAKNKLPVKRFWTNDLTESHILDALKNLRDDDRDPMLRNLLSAAYGRQHSDYRFGMNLSRAATLKMNTRVACGRVKTPILAIVCRREEEIRNFKPHTWYGIKAVYDAGFEGTLFDKNAMSAEEGADADKREGIVWFDKKEDAEALCKEIPKNAKVLSFVKKPIRTKAPKLFKLATLQIAAGKLGFNDADTLTIIQSLYEREYLSYPRTDCEYLSSEEDYYGILRAIMAVPDLAPFVKKISKSAIEATRRDSRWINDAALKESGHSAIRPTTKSVDYASLTEEEQAIYSLVCRQFVAIFLPPLMQERTQLIAESGGHLFRSSGKTLVDAGFTEIFGTKFTDMVIPEYSAGADLLIDRFQISEKNAVCPKRYTSPEIIAACENPAKYLDDPTLKALGKRLKIGTPATRSGIIRQLIDVDGYLEEKKEKKTTYIVPTETGDAIIKNLGPCDICKVDLTGIWEEQLEDVRTGKMSLAELEASMRKDVERMIKDIRSREMASLGKAKTHKKIGVCPKCGKDLHEGEKGFFCMGFRDTPKCGVGSWKDVCGVTLSAEEFLLLMDGKELEKSLDDDPSVIQKLTYDFASNKVVTIGGKPIGKCPVCGKTMLETGTDYHCEDPKCTCKASKTLLGAQITREDFEELLAGHTIEKKLRKKDGTKWPQVLRIKADGDGYEFVRRENRTEESKFDCPCCQNPLSEDRWKLTCSCGFKCYKTQCGHEMTEEDLEDLFFDGETRVFKGLKWPKGGEKFSASVVIDKDKKGTKFRYKK